MIAPAGPAYLVGLDVGSTTVKAVVVRPDDDAIVWRDYRRHEMRQPETVIEFLTRMQGEIGIAPGNARVFVTGSGGQPIADLVGAKFVQEVHAVALAVETRHPEVHSVIELGGQDAKIIVFMDDERTGRKRKIPSMNDKCAGGTGAVIDKIAAKLKIPAAELCDQRYDGVRLHPVAGKCGVFAETDINGLQKQAVPAEELIASLFDAIVLQNLTVLTRGHTLRPQVLLLGGPNRFIRGMLEAWRANIPRLWRERHVPIPDGATPDDLITVPPDAEYFAALGAVEYGRAEPSDVGRWVGTDRLQQYVRIGRHEEKVRSGSRGLNGSEAETAAFARQYARRPFAPAAFRPGDVVRGFVGVDAGSTSTKAVLLAEDGTLLCKEYSLSNGNPIEDTVDLFERLRGQVESQRASLEVLGVATTGYAKDVLQPVLGADVAVVETVAHAESAMHLYHDPHVIVDVGGQDIKLILMKDGRVTDFKLNTQCSAGNGYFLQSTAEAFGLTVEQYADVALSARAMPVFGYGCAVFLQSDIVNFQRQGWRADEILAGLAAVLPKNVFLYVAGVPNLARLGSRFVLQGGTQRNLAVVKAEVDFIHASFAGSGERPEIVVHEHCGEAGAIGAALEAMRLAQLGRPTTFIGLDEVRAISYRTTRSEDTRCRFCQNHCLRTFVDVRLRDDERRVIIATCEKGSVDDVDRMRSIKARLDEVTAANPNLVEIAAREIWRAQKPPRVADAIPARSWSRRGRERTMLMQTRHRLRIGVPRVLNMYAYAPLFSAYFESLGVSPANLVYSDVTSTELYRTGSSRGAIDPCFPSKVAIAHVHNLIAIKHARAPIDCIFFPMFDVLDSPIVNTCGQNACPTVAATPESVEAAFTKEHDLFAAHGIRYLHPLVNVADRRLFALQMFEAWCGVLGLSREENDRACEAGFRALADFGANIRTKARLVLDALEREDRLGIVMLARPYHHDPGLNHEILEQFQQRGYPIFSQGTLPLDDDLLERLFGEEVRAGTIAHPLDISDVWKNPSAASTNQKLWAAKFTARHPNLIGLELSSFKCGHDAPIYTVVERILECAGTPYFAFKDIDENRPAASIRMRVETIDYFLKRHHEALLQRKQARGWIERDLAANERRLSTKIEGRAEQPAMALDSTAAFARNGVAAESSL